MCQQCRVTTTRGLPKRDVTEAGGENSMQGRTLQITETLWHYVYNVRVAERACVESKYYLYDIVNMQATRRGTARDVSEDNCAVIVDED